MKNYLYGNSKIVRKVHFLLVLSAVTVAMTFGMANKANAALDESGNKVKTVSQTKTVTSKNLKKRQLINMVATAYDLSYASCGKNKNHPAYGITRSGTKTVRGRTVAVDPRVIPLGTKLYVKFDPAYSSMNGIYIAEDTGGAIKGNRIDVFVGDKNTKFAYKFGVRNCKVSIVK